MRGERGSEGSRGTAWGHHGQGEKGETEAKGRVLLQQVRSRNNSRDQPPGFPLAGSMGSLCHMIEEKFQAIQNMRGNRQMAEPPMSVPVQEEAIVGAMVIRC